MGGVPYTSTGCNTCRRRKVKCDETKPECLRCIKYGHPCSGYERKRVFINEKTGTETATFQKLADSSKLDAYGSNKQPITRFNPEIPRLNVNPEIRAQLVTAFIDWYLPPSHLLPTGTGKNLLHTLPDIIGGSPILEKAVTSLTSAFLAKQNQDQQLLHYSSRLYNNAMRALHRKITVGAKLGQDILYTTVVFQFYEMINCSPPGFMAWIAHVQGSAAVGSDRSRQGEETVVDTLFHRQFKYVILCDAVGKRKAPSLYKMVEWRCSSPEPIDELLDQLAECLTIMEKVDHFMLTGTTASEEDYRKGNQILLACLKLEENLHRVCVSVQEKMGTSKIFPKNAIPQGDFRASLSTDLFHDIYQFPSLTCAELHIVYWTVLTLLYPLIGELISALGQPDETVSLPKYDFSVNGKTTNSVPLGTDAYANFTALAGHYADEICRSVLYCIQPDMKTLGAQMLLAPLSQCVQFYYVEGSTEKLKWCQSVFMALSQLGLGIGPLLKDMIWPHRRSAQGRKSSAIVREIAP